MAAHEWYSPIWIAHFIFNNHWSITGRAEYYNDENEVIIAAGTENGFQATGFSFNVDYRIRENAVWRVEGRILSSKDDIFAKGNQTVNSNSSITTSLAVSF